MALAARRPSCRHLTGARSEFEERRPSPPLHLAARQSPGRSATRMKDGATAGAPEVQVRRGAARTPTVKRHG
jgi:hypothetical protein